MKLASLPDLAVENIIHYAALEDIKALQKRRWNELIKWNPHAKVEVVNPGKTWMMILHKYGQVSRHWRSVILQSTKLFDTEEKRLMEISLNMDTEGSQLRQMIREGYMERASKISLNLYIGKTRSETETLNTIRKAAGISSIETYEFFAYEDFAYQGERKTRSMSRESLEHWNCFIDILKLSKKCKKVDISLGWMLHQRDAEVFFECVLAVLKIDHIKSIEFDTGLDFYHAPKKVQGRTILVSDHHINWDFIKRRRFGNTKIDHIEKFLISKSVPGVGWFRSPDGWTQYNFDFIYDRSHTKRFCF